MTTRLVSIFPLILCKMNPIQMPKMYGDSLAHGFSYKPLKNAKFSWMIKLFANQNSTIINPKIEGQTKKWLPRIYGIHITAMKT